MASRLRGRLPPLMREALAEFMATFILVVCTDCTLTSYCKFVSSLITSFAAVSGVTKMAGKFGFPAILKRAQTRGFWEVCVIAFSVLHTFDCKFSRGNYLTADSATTVVISVMFAFVFKWREKTTNVFYEHFC